MALYIGAHVSTAGGFEKAVERAADLGCNALQLFTGSPRVWKSKAASEFDYKGFLEARARLGIERAVIHATYLVNLASDKEELVEKSVAALINDMAVCAGGEFEGVVVHLGSHQGRGYGAVREQLVTQIRRIIDGSPKGSRFLIENSAGQKGKIASELEEVRDLMEGVGSEGLGLCVDTCHAHAAGYSLGSTKSQVTSSKEIPNTKHQVQKGLFGETVDERESFDRVLVEGIERLGLWGSLECVHVNESRDPLGSGRDRHENLGEGEIGSQGLKEFLNHEKLADKPLILEVPGFDGKGPDRKNVEILKRLVDSK